MNHEKDQILLNVNCPNSETENFKSSRNKGSPFESKCIYQQILLVHSDQSNRASFCRYTAGENGNTRQLTK